MSSIKKLFIFIWETTKVLIIALAIVVPIRYFLFQPFVVKGQSMTPNFENGDYLIVDEISYRFQAPERGDVVVFKAPVNPSQRFIKRIVGLPGETIEIKDGKILVYKNGKIYQLEEKDYLPFDETGGDLKVILGENEYFVLGDNRQFSFDSRSFGSLSKNAIIGKVFLRAWPIKKLDFFQTSASLIKL